MRILYKELKTNNTIVKMVVLGSVLICISAFYFVYKASDNANKILYAINDQGIIIPLNRIDDKRDQVKIVKSAIAYFVDQYYTLDQFNYSDKAEKVLWLAAEDFQVMYKDKQSKGYFNRFVQTGAIQKAKLIDTSIKIDSYDSPYQVNYQVLIEISNGGNTNKYIVTNTATLLKVNLNYPYNPFGLLYTNFVESNLKEYKEN